MRINWTNKASTDLDHIEAYIAQKNPVAAIEQVLRIIRVVEDVLVEQPLMGRVGKEHETRELVIAKTSYVLVYQFRSGQLDILHVDHHAQRK